MIVLIFLIAFLPRLISITSVEQGGDETLYICSGLIYIHNIERHYTEIRDWRINSEHPPLPKYLVGLFVRFFTDFRLPSNVQGKDELWILHNYYQSLPVDVLFWARIPYAIIGAITCILVFLLGTEMRDPVFGFLASLFASFNGFWFFFTISVWCVDPPMTLFTTLALLLFYRGIKKRSSPYIMSSGISFGLALSSKYLAVYGVLVAILWFAYIFHKERSNWIEFLRRNQRLKLSLILFFPLMAIPFIIVWGILWLPPEKVLRLISISFERHSAMGHFGLTNSLENAFIPFNWLFISAFREAPPYYVLYAPLERFFFIIGSTYLLTRAIKRRVTDEEVLIGLYLAIPLACLSAMLTKLSTYTLILVPALALSCTLGVEKTLFYLKQFKNTRNSGEGLLH